MPGPSEEALTSILGALLVAENTEARVREAIEEGRIESACVWLLGALDAKVEGGAIPGHVAEQYYQVLGLCLSPTEMTRLRQYNASRRLQEGADLPKKLS